jgi:VanZ family protein
MRAEKEIDKKVLFVLWLCFTIFVVYGSLVPLNFRFIPFSDALDKFLQIPYLTLGIESREDWIANLLIYIPISFGAALLLISDRMSLTIKSIACFIIACYCACLAVIVEFIQLYFPGRTVSLNDIIAEVIGSFLGAVIFLCFGQQIKALINKVKLHGIRSIQGFLTIYLIWYLAYSLFPFDFLISLEEVKNKFVSNSWSVFVINSRVHEGVFSVILNSFVEVLSIAPIGFLLYISNFFNKKNLFELLCFGAIGGVSLNLYNFFLPQGVLRECLFC